jgi:tRNA pseudouridine13 synthase
LIPAADVERAVGIEFYASGGAPCTGRVRSTAEDFVVEEQLADLPVIKEGRPEYLPLYRVQKRSMDTIHMASDLAREIRSDVSYGGMKDKRAVAIQYVTPRSRKSLRPARITKENYTAELVGYVPEPMSRGRIAGNRFTIVLRDCCAEVGERLEEAMRLAKERRVPNYYGLQRFGTSGAGTHLVGRALVTREFEEAVKLLLEAPLRGGQESSRGAREAMASGRYKEGISLLPRDKDVEKAVAAELIRHPKDWVGALRRVPIKLRRLYVQAYQSYIFNRSLSGALADGLDISKMELGDNWAETSRDGLLTSAPRGVRDRPTERAVPMVQVVGYAFRNYGSRFDRCIKAVLEAEGVNPGSFYVKEMQEVSAEGGFRRPHLAIDDPSWNVDGSTATMKFTLGKGQYATVIIREVLKPRGQAASDI